MDITYRFVATGQGDVERAFVGIEAAAKRQKKAVDDATKAVRQGAARGPTTDGERAARAQERATARAATQADRSAKRAADAQIRETERAQKHVARIRDKHFADEQRKDERASREKTKRAERAAQQAARKETAARERAHKEQERDRSRTMTRLRDAAVGIGIGAAVSGGAMLAAAGRDAMRVQEAAASIAIQGRAAGEKGRDPTELRQSFEATARNTPGQTAEGIADAVARFVTLTGDMNTALNAQGSFAMIASASGGNVGDVAEAGAALSKAFDIKSVSDMTEALAALNLQGKNGAFELKDAAAQFQSLAAAGAAFGIQKGVAGVKQLGGLTQIARSGTGSAEQAGTAVQAMLSAFVAKQKLLGAAGVDVFDSTGKARDIETLLAESISKVGGSDMGAKKAGLLKVFDREGMRAINPLVDTYATAFQGAKGTDTERTAIATNALREAMSKAINTVDAVGEAQQDAADRQRTASAQLTAAWESIQSKTGSALLPAFANLATKFSENGGLLDPLIEGAAIAATALTDLAEFLKAKGILKTKAATPEEAAKAAKEKLASFDARHAADNGPMDAEAFAERQRLQDSADATEFALKADQARKKELAAVPSSFIDAYAGADTNASRTDYAKTEQARLVAEGVKNNDFTTRSDTAMRLLGENDTQRAERKKLIASQDESTALNVEQVQASLDAITANAARAAAAMGQVGSAAQPSNI